MPFNPALQVIQKAIDNCFGIVRYLVFFAGTRRGEAFPRSATRALREMNNDEISSTSKKDVLARLLLGSGGGGLANGGEGLEERHRVRGTRVFVAPRTF